MNMSIIYNYYTGEYQAKKNPHKQLKRCFPFCVLVYVIHGEYFCEIGEETHVAHEHELLIVPPYIYHNIYMKENGLLNWAHIKAIYHSADILFSYRVPYILTGSDAERIGSMISGFHDTYHSEIQKNLMFDSIISRMYNIIIGHSQRKQIDGKYASIITAVHDEIISFPEKNYTLEMLASKCGLSITTFSKYFNQMYQKTPMKFILHNRITYSLHLLLSDKSIKEISYSLGFYDEYHFSKQFKKVLGCSPSEYRATHTNDI